MIRLLSVKDQTRQSYKITPTQGTFVSLFVEKYCIISKFGFSQVAAVKFCFFRFIWLIMSAKRTYAEVVSGFENTPDDDQSWMRAYQQERGEDALKKGIKLRKI